MATIRRQVKNMVKNYSEAEVKVREATSNDPWGPSSTLMSEISDLTYNIVALGEVMRMIWKRLNDHGKNWRHVYKSLVLLDYLIKNGNEKVAQQCKEHIVAIQTLKDFVYMEEQKDQGQSVREKAKQLVNLLRDDERLKQERTKAFKARERFAQNAMGISSDNKMTYATTNVNNRGGAYGASKPNYSDPYGGAGASTPTPNPLTADLEAVRPSDTNEEDLQIKLAIMLSQQEHEEEAQKKRADEAKLSLAIEQSKAEGQPNGLVDLRDNGFGKSDPWATNGNVKASSNDLESGSDDLFPPIFNHQTSNGTTNSSADPWGQSMDNNKQQPIIPNNNNSAQLTTNPWQSSNNGGITLADADPWATAAASNQQQKSDDFDLFTTNRVVNQSPLTTANNQSQNTSNQAVDPFGDFFGTTNKEIAAQNTSQNNSTNPWNSDSAKPLSDDLFSSNSQTSSIEKEQAKPSSFNQTANQRKTPESFLGENSSLVNLENLIPARPKSTNPFGGNLSLSTQPSTLSTSNSSGQLNNPFLAQQALQNQKNPTISQLQSQQKQQQQAAFPSFGQQQNNSNINIGQLQQPLIPPSNSNQNIAPLSFNQNSILSPTPPPIMSQQPMSNFNDFNAFNSAAATTTNQNSAQSTNPFLMM